MMLHGRKLFRRRYRTMLKPLIRNSALFALILLTFITRAQYYDLGQDPASVRWKFIKTEHFKIIFPAGIEDQAQHIASGFEKVYEPLSADMKIAAVKVPVVLHNRAILSNAEVPWAPKRIEFFMCPGQDDYAQPWADQLMLHEFRHVVQYSKINQGLTKGLSYIFGQQITAGVIGTFVPLWFVEGDAVYTETAFSNSGRGRMPSFSMKMRAQVLEKGIYNYNKACFGSYRTFTPNRYEFGYQLVATARKHFTGEIWERAMDKAGKLPLMVTPFNYGLKKVSGMGKVKLYKYCFYELDSLWHHQRIQTKVTASETIPVAKNKIYTSYNFPVFAGDKSYIMVRSGMNDITRFVRIDSAGREHKLFTPGQYSLSSFSVYGTKMVWAETANDPRWENQTYSVIKIFDIQKKRARQLTHRSRYFVPALDRQGKKIVCVEQSITGQSSLVVLDAATGEVLRRFRAHDDDFLMTPSWSETGREIVFIALNRYGKRLCLLDSAGTSHDLTTAGFDEMAQPVLIKNHVYFVAAWTGISNIFALDTATKILFQVTSALYGVADPYVDNSGKELIYADYTADGYRPVKASLDPTEWMLFEKTDNPQDKFFLPVETSRAQVIDFYDKEKSNYPVKPYSKILNLFNIHSWGPVSVNADNTTVKPGVEFLSQNLLSTMIVSAGYEHEWNKPVSQVYAKLSYRGWYPRIDMQFAYRFNKEDTITWNIMFLQAGIKIPWNINRGKYFIFLQPEVDFNFYRLIPQKNYPAGNFSGYYQAMEYKFFGYHVLKRSLRDINPRWGQMLEFSYKHTPFDGKQFGDITAVQGILFFPGIGHHHSLNIYAGYQRNKAKQYMFNDLVSLPHGYNSAMYPKIFSTQTAYEMPLFYPDWTIGSFLYIKRFRGALYYDHAWVTDRYNKIQSLNSAGLALLADFHLLRFLAPLSMGIRATCRLDNKTMSYEFIYSVNFDQLMFRRGFSRTGF